MVNLKLLSPEIFLSVLALILMLADLWVPRKHGKLLFHLGIAFSAAGLLSLGMAYSDPANYQGMGTSWVVDPMGLFFKVIVLITTLLSLLLSLDYAGEASARTAPTRHLGTFAGLVLLCSVGMMLLVSSVDLLLVFLSLELVSITSFILSGFERTNLKSSEGAMKYFLIGAFSSAVMVFGISLYYGATGTTSLIGVRDQSGTLVGLASLMILVGFGFKASVAPFHLWVPDAYEGAPTPVTTYLSIAPKVAALAAMLRVFLQLMPGDIDMPRLFACLAALTMTVGNFTALFQTNVKRLLAYSSIAQAGYILIAFVSPGGLGKEAVLMYALAYVFMNVGAFTVAIMIGNEDSYELEAYDGLASRSFGVSLLMAFFLLSLAGIPPTAGFIAKFYVFAAAIEAKYYWLAIVGVLNSVVSVYYYLRIAYHMFFMPARKREPLSAGFYLYSGLAVAAFCVVFIGLYPDPFIASAKISSATLTEAARSVKTALSPVSVPARGG
ncbi:MAG: NADH-quinone oxidoreductase subunit N [Elusimicrobia bacterium]|nr:NADH-quinone oxidoreductase subunit N [Elusimicrobiota bacterium]